MSKLHESHPGMVAMNILARELVCYPELGKDIEKLVCNCFQCQAHKVKPPQNFTEWPKTSKPWQRVQIDQFFEKHVFACSRCYFSLY